MIRRREIICGVALAVALFASCAPVGEPSPPLETTPVDVTSALGGDQSASEGYLSANAPRRFSFPDDHGPHPGFRTEWWYVTGNLESEDQDARFGFQFTIFRYALAPEAPDRPSSLATSELYMAHFAVVDGAERRFSAFERFERPVLSLAGAEGNPLRVWLGDWTLESLESERDAFVLEAAEGDTSLALELRAERPLVLQGDDGLSRKGSGETNASYYYSYTRLAARGELVSDGRRHRVSGLAWLDREWSTSVLERGQTGWDWFSIQLDDGVDLMLYRIRREDGRVNPWDAGKLVFPDGRDVSLGPQDYSLTPERTWRSPASGGEYPVSWRLEIPAYGIDLRAEALIDAQELDVSVQYWEGAIDVLGTRAGMPVSGRGYLEMTGYAQTRGQAR